MEILILLVFLFTVGDPEWLGRHLARADAWRKYYSKSEERSQRRAIAKRRLKRIRKQNPRAFRRRK